MGMVASDADPSTPAPLDLDRLREALARYDVPLAAVSLLLHATTVVTNALLEMNGAKTGFVTTAALSTSR
jgi:N-methylhydantoinase A/oxoprolinase/acetone carboxylase beta subunit